MGDAFMGLGAHPLPYAHLDDDDTDFWYPDMTAAVLPSVDRRSVRIGSECEISVETGLQNRVPAINFTLPTFTPPFHLEPEPCFTPEAPDPEQLVNACVKKSGIIKIVDDLADCEVSDTPISLLSQ